MCWHAAIVCINFIMLLSVELQHEMKQCGKCRQMDGTGPEGMHQSWGSL